MKYKVIQIFQEKYSLSDFIKNYECYFEYENFSDLNVRFLSPLRKIFYFTGVWGQEEEEAYEKITKVKLSLEGKFILSKKNKRFGYQMDN